MTTETLDILDATEEDDGLDCECSLCGAGFMYQDGITDSTDVCLDCQRKQEAIDEAQEAVDDAESDLSSLDDELADLMEQVKDKRAEIRSKKAEVEASRKRLAKLEA